MSTTSQRSTPKAAANIWITAAARDINSKTYLEAAVEYARTFGRHEVTGLLVYQNTQQVIGNPSSVLESLPFRNQGSFGTFYLYV